MHDDPRIRRFRTLHESGCFVIPNPWDTGTARYLERVGFPALATTSAGFAFSRGCPDAVTALGKEQVLAHIRELVGATPLPVSADFQNGYAHEPDELAANVAECLATGAAGLSIEDATGEPEAPLYEHGLAVERVRAACAARDEASPGAVLTARAEAFLLGHPDAERLVLERLVAFAEAGADCLFAPGVREPSIIARVVAAVAPKPVNVLVASPHPELTTGKLAALGVRRISVGSALARVAWGAFMQAARSIVDGGTFDGLAGAATFPELNAVFEGGS